MEALARLDNSDDEGLKGRLSPQNTEAEAQLLGAILLNNETYFRISDVLQSDHFFFDPHRQIFEIIEQLLRSGKTATPITVKTFLPGDFTVGDIAAAQYLLRLVADASTIVDAEDLAEVVHDLAVRRNLIRIGQDMVNIAYDAPIHMPPQSQIEDAERRLFGLAEAGRTESGFGTFSTAVTEAIEMAAAAFKRDGGLSGVSTGLVDLDRKLGGLQRSDLVILAARPAMGKTALATNIALNIARARAKAQSDPNVDPKDGGVVAFFSLEMSSEQLATRILSEQASIPSSSIRRGVIDENEYGRLVEASRQVQNYPLYIDETGGLSIAQLVSRARRLKRQRGLDVMFVDYLQLATGSSSKSQANRVQEITEITTSLKALAKELDVPIIALSQLSRQVESREDKRPQLSDLRESGSIEQDADVVLFIYREAYYLENKMPEEGTEEFFKWQARMEDVINKAEVIVAKQRHGPTGSVDLQFDGNFTRFSSLARDDQFSS